MHTTRRALRPGAILALVCGANFMVTLDIAIVNVALPSIQRDLGVDQTDLQWVVITYGLLLGGFLLLGGRAADLLGRRRVLVTGLGLFTLASLGAAAADTLAQLVAFRGLQGLGGALTVPSAVSILVSTFAEGADRNKALAIFGAVGGSAASIGVIVSGVLTSGPGWEWIFLLNLPVGVVLVALILALVPPSGPVHRGGIDVAGAVTVTAGLMAVVYALNKSIDDGWTSATTLGFGAVGLALLGSFVAVEARASAPLLPLGMFRRRTLVTANAIALLGFGAFFATIFQASLFMQQVLRYSAVRTGLAYLAIAGTVVVVAAGIAARVVGRLGVGWTITVGQGFSAAGLLLLARVPVDAAYWTDLFPGFILMGVGVGFTAMAVQVAAFIGVEERFSGLAGGMVETSREVGGALGVAVVATVAIARANDVLGAAGGDPAAAPLALTDGFQRGALVIAALNVAAGLVAALVLRRAERPRPARAAAGEIEITGPPAVDPASAA